MNKLSTIISLLFIVAFVNSKVSYSDIVSSLAEISSVNGGVEHVEQTLSSFKESTKLFGAFDERLSSECKHIQERSDRRNQEISNILAGLNKQVTDMQNDNKSAAEDIVNLEKTLESNNSGIENLNNQKEEDRSSVEAKTLNLVQRRRILQRLSNLVRDELTGEQRSATVGNFNVDKKLSGYSFVEVHNQLKELKSTDAMTKSMITTLIMITQNKNVFANHESVAKIDNLINQIIEKDAKTVVQLREESEKKQESLNNQINNFRQENDKIFDSLSNKRNTLVANARLNTTIQAEIVSVTMHQQRANKRSKNNADMCNNLKTMIGVHTRIYEETTSRLTELKNQLQ
jgi:chromosome segregation ATPase